MSFLGDLFSNPIQTTWDSLSSLPGSPEAFASGVYGGVSGDLSWNPYSDNNSVWDTGAGGTELSEDPNNRQIGRQIGTAIGAAFTGGALGAAGQAGGATNAALIDSSLGTAGYGASSASLAGAGSGATLGGSVARGALTNAGTAAARGGNGSDILKGALYGGIGGGVGNTISGYNPGSAITDSPYGQSIINRGITGGVNAGISGGNIGQGALSGGINAGVNGGLNMAGNAIGNYFKDNSMPTDGYDPRSASAILNGYTGQSRVPQDSFISDQGQSQPLGFSQGTDFNPSFSGGGESSSGSGFSSPISNFMSSLTGNGGLGQIGTGLMAAYNANEARKRARGALDQVNGLYAPNSPYAMQMQQELSRKDAASGRNSQYGPRAANLAAALTQSRANTLTSGGYQTMLGQARNAQQQLPISLASMANSNWGKGLIGQAGNSIGNYFAGQNNPNYSHEGNNFQPPMNGPAISVPEDWAPGD